MAPNVRVQRRTQRVRGTPIVPIVVPNVLVVISVADHGYARVSLGRSIGYVPADRGIISITIFPGTATRAPLLAFAACLTSASQSAPTDGACR